MTSVWLLSFRSSISLSPPLHEVRPTQQDQEEVEDELMDATVAEQPAVVAVHVAVSEELPTHPFESSQQFFLLLTRAGLGHNGGA